MGSAGYVIAPVARRAAGGVGLLRTSLAAARAYRVAPWRIAPRALALHRRRFPWDEQLLLGLLDPALGEEALADHVSLAEMREARQAVNPVAVAPLADEKALFYRVAAAEGLPVPALYAIVAPDAGWSHTGRAIDGPEAFARFLREDVPERFVVKPSQGAGGIGVRVVRRVGGALLLPDGAAIDPAALRAEATSAFGRLAVVQEALTNHPALDALWPTETLECVRAMTVVARDGTVRVPAALFKIGLGGGPTDNFQEGRTGNASCDVDPRTGRLGRPRFPRPDGPGLLASDHLPNGVRATGFELPDWARLLQVVERAARLMQPARAVGWDVALTPAGPVIVEANLAFSPWPSPSAREVRDLLLAGA